MTIYEFKTRKPEEGVREIAGYLFKDGVMHLESHDFPENVQKYLDYYGVSFVGQLGETAEAAEAKEAEEAAKAKEAEEAAKAKEAKEAKEAEEAAKAKEAEETAKASQKK